MKNYFYITGIIQDKSFQKDIIDVIDKSENIQENNTNVKAKMTDWQMKDSPGFQSLSRYIIHFAKQNTIEKYGINLNFKIIHMWGVCYKNGDYTIPHDHWPSTWSSVYYIDPPENSPELTFPELNVSIKPEDGMLILFPGWVIHEVPKKAFLGKRYVVSTNLCPIIEGC